MKGKITLLAGAAVGYVLGARAGRDRYESLKTQASQAADKVRHDPRVQEKATQAQDLAKDKAATAAAAVKDKVHSSDDPTGTTGTGTTPTPPGSTGSGHAGSNGG